MAKQIEADQKLKNLLETERMTSKEVVNLVVVYMLLNALMGLTFPD